MTQKGISLKQINGFLRRLGLVLVVGVGHDQDMRIKNGSTRLWIERVAGYEERCETRLPAIFSQALYCGDIDIGNSGTCWWYSRDAGKTWGVVDDFSKLPDDLKALWDGEKGDAPVSLPL